MVPGPGRGRAGDGDAAPHRARAGDPRGDRPAAPTCSASASACSCCSSAPPRTTPTCLGLLPGRVERLRGRAPAAAHGLERRRAGRSAPTRSATACRPCAYFAHSYAVRDAGRRAPSPRPRSTACGSPRVVAAGPGRRRAVPPGALVRRRRCTMLRGFLRWSRCCVGASFPASTCRAAGSSRASTSSTCATAATPSTAAVRYAEQGADEICWLNITAGDEAWRDLLERGGARRRVEVDVPVTVGGGVKRGARTCATCSRAGADKVSINTAALRDPGPRRRVRRRHGSQCIVVAIDAKRRATAAGGRTSPAAASRPSTTRVAWAERGRGARRRRAARDVDGHRRHQAGLRPRPDRRDPASACRAGDRLGRRRRARSTSPTRSTAGCSAALAASIFHDGTYTVRGGEGDVPRRGGCRCADARR